MIACSCLSYLEHSSLCVKQEMSKFHCLKYLTIIIGFPLVLWSRKKYFCIDSYVKETLWNARSSFMIIVYFSNMTTVPYTIMMDMFVCFSLLNTYEVQLVPIQAQFNIILVLYYSIMDPYFLPFFRLHFNTFESSLQTYDTNIKNVQAGYPHLVLQQHIISWSVT